MDDTETTVTIDNRADFSLWAIERSQEIVNQEATALALAVRDGDEEAIRSAGNALGAAITEAMLEVIDGLAAEE